MQLDQDLEEQVIRDRNLDGGAGDHDGRAPSPASSQTALYSQDRAAALKLEKTVERASEKEEPVKVTLEGQEDPHQWSFRKRLIVTLTPCIWTLALTYDSTAYVSSSAYLTARYGISREVNVLGVSLFVLGFAAGPLCFGPASEVFGRQPVYSLCAVGFSAFAWLTAYAPNAVALLLARFLAGFFGSASINNGPATIADMTAPAKRIVWLLPYALSAFLGPSFGPLCGTFLDIYASPRWNFIVQAIFTTVTSITMLFMPETHGPTLLKRKERKLGLKVESLTVSQITGVFGTALKRPVMFICTDIIVASVCIYLSLLYAILYSFFLSFEVVWIDTHQWSQQAFCLTYITLGLGFTIGAGLMAALSNKIYEAEAARCRERGVPTPPEARLKMAKFAAPAIPLALFLFAWTAPYRNTACVVFALIGETAFTCGMIVIFTSFIPYLVECYTVVAASTLAAAMASRSLAACVFPLFSRQMYERLSVQGATSLLAGLTCLMVPLPFLFDRYARRRREQRQKEGSPP